MTDQETQALIDRLTAAVDEFAAAKAAIPMPEAGGIAFATLYSKTGAAYNVTARDATAWGALKELVNTVRLAGLTLEMSTTKPAPPDAAPPHVPADQRIAREEGNPALAATLKASAEAVPPPPDGKVYETVDTQEIRIEPKADGLVSVEFWNPGRKYAEEYVKWKPENVMGLLKHVMTVPTNDDGSIRPAQVTCPVKVYYTLGKEKTGPNAKPGARWHDVSHVRPA